jgi:hypothetical protein
MYIYCLHYSSNTKRSHKTVGIKIFFTNMLDRRILIRIRICTSDYRIRILEAHKHTDSDPQH